MSKATRALLDTASEMFDETGCVPGIDGEEVRAETMVPDAKEYISESIDNPEVLCDSETWDRPGFTLVLSCGSGPPRAFGSLPLAQGRSAPPYYPPSLDLSAFLSLSRDQLPIISRARTGIVLTRDETTALFCNKIVNAVLGLRRPGAANFPSQCL
jgi:hypothetical protein